MGLTAIRGKKGLIIFAVLLSVVILGSGSLAYGAVFVDYSYSASRIVDVDPEEPETGEDAEFTVRFRDAQAELVANQEVRFYVASNRDAETLELVDGYDGSVDPITGEDAWEVDATTDEDGQVAFEIFSYIPGTAEIQVGKAWDEGDGEVDNLIGSEEVVFAADDVTDIAFDIDNRYPAVGENFTLKAELMAGAYEAGAGLEVTFKEQTNDEWEEIDTIETDEDGEAELTISRTETGEYYYQAVHGDVESGVRFVDIAETGDIDSIEAYQETLFVDEADDEFDVYFAIYDEFDNKITDDDEFVVTVTDPEGNTYDAASTEVSVSLEDDEDEATYRMFRVTVDQDGIDLVGAYEVEGRISGTTISDLTEVNVAEFGEVVDMELELTQEVARPDHDPDEPEFDAIYANVTLIDEHGVERQYDPDDEEVVFSSESVSVATIGSRSGEITVQSDGETEIVAYHQEKDLEASGTFSVAGAAEYIEVETELNPEMLEGEVVLTFRDADDNRAEGAGEYSLIRVPDEVTISDKEDFEDGRATFQVEAEESGVYEMLVISDEGISEEIVLNFDEAVVDGEFDVIITVQDEEGDYIGGASVQLGFLEIEADDFGIAEFDEVQADSYDLVVDAPGYEAYEDTLDVDAPIEETITLEEREIAEEIIMTIDETLLTVDGRQAEMDVAPFIEDDRTFLPFRGIGELLGADVDYEHDEREITAVLEDTEVVFTLGEEVAYVNGETMEMDVAPYLDADAGRTLMPVRFFVEALGASVSYDHNTREVTIER